RRCFLKYVGAGAGALFTSGSLAAMAQLGCRSASPADWVAADGSANWRSPAYPVPLPGDPGQAAADAKRLAAYQVVDDLVLPDGFRYDVVAEWGDTFGPADDPERQIHFGYNNDYTGLVEIASSENEYWLMVNHEYVAARPWLEAYEERYGEKPPRVELVADPEKPELYPRGVFHIDDWRMELGYRVSLDNAEAMAAIPPAVRQTIRDLNHRILSEVGVSVLRVRRLADGTFRVLGEAPDHRRISAYDRQNVSSEARAASRFTGPAAYLLPEPPAGTMANCSGGTTPWGTFLTCEENFYNEVHEDVTPEGQPIADASRYFGARGRRVNGVYDFTNPTPPNIYGNGHGLDEPLDGRGFGWVTEVDPATGKISKHTALGRFRHENVALRCEAGKRLAAYMGDDRRGGHMWKFVSDGMVEDPTAASNSELLERGTLYVARFEDDFTGRWIPIEAATPLRTPEPEQCFSAHVMVPSRFVGGTVAVGDTERDDPALEVADWQAIIESYTGKPFAESTLGDLVRPEPAATAEATTERQRGVLVMDAFAMANACGGTPMARPEDLEIHPLDASVYIAFTDASDGSSGAPDQRIFPDSSMETSRQYGAIYRLIEGGLESAESDPAATTFSWGKFVSSGEVAERGGGFASADNMVFDPQGNLWMMTDVSPSALNVPTTRQFVDGTNPGGRSFRGVFGNNALFMIPTRGPDAGVPQLFALAPMEAELCGPTFTDDGRTLILSVQHPGESWGARRAARPDKVQSHIVQDRDNQPFEQRRTVPQGSNFPHGELDRAPRPCVVCITREA
ncbi:MAG: alkaline phosphatase PhoX, partial [Acidobacteriota bacterium]